MICTKCSSKRICSIFNDVFLKNYGEISINIEKCNYYTKKEDIKNIESLNSEAKKKTVEINPAKEISKNKEEKVDLTLDQVDRIEALENKQKRAEKFKKEELTKTLGTCPTCNGEDYLECFSLCGICGQSTCGNCGTSTNGMNYCKECWSKND